MRKKRGMKMRKTYFWSLAAVVGTVLVAGCNHDTGPAPATVTIDSPADLSTVTLPFDITFTVTGWAIASGGEHLHWYLDGALQNMLYDTSPITVTTTEIPSPGGYTIILELVNPNHSLTGVKDTITITVN